MRFAPNEVRVEGYRVEDLPGAMLKYPQRLQGEIPASRLFCLRDVTGRLSRASANGI